MSTGNWSAKAELDYTAFPGRNVAGASSAVYHGMPVFDTPNFRATTGLVQLKIGLNYRFGGT